MIWSTCSAYPLDTADLSLGLTLALVGMLGSFMVGYFVRTHDFR